MSELAVRLLALSLALIAFAAGVPATWEALSHAGAAFLAAFFFWVAVRS